MQALRLQLRGFDRLIEELITDYELDDEPKNHEEKSYRFKFADGLRLTVACGEIRYLRIDPL